jgi:Ca2+/H+ antiporter, TMEM165/GDT1 family
MKEFWTAFILVFASEMGDKSQIVSFGFGTQQRLIIVLPAIFLGIAMMLGISALIGEVAGTLVPRFWMQVISAALFVLFAILSFRGQHEDVHKPVGTKFGAFFAILFTFIISELGDKTIFATMTLAGHSRNFYAVWIGGTLGMFAADVLAILVANLLGKALPAKATRIGSGIVFLFAGVWALWGAFSP